MTSLAEQDSLRRRAEGPALARVLAAALAAVEPAAAIERAVEVEAGGLRIGTQVLPLRPEAGVWCIAVGKAAVVMATALVRRIPAARLRGGVVVAKHEPAPQGETLPLPVVLGAHPIPEARSLAAGRAVLDVLARVREGDVVVVLLSGGASSLMVAPAPGLSLDELRTLGRALLESGAPIEDVNAVRKALDSLKGGGLLRHAAPARVATLVLSDVVDAPLHVVGSGPTLPDGSGRAAARAVLERYGIEAPSGVRRRLASDDGCVRNHLPSSAAEAATQAERASGDGCVRNHLPGSAAEAATRAERTSDDGCARNHSPGGAAEAAAPVVELASNATAVAAAIAAARAEGWQVRCEPALRGEAREVGRALATALRALRPSVPTLLVAGGETTVTVRGRGRGGRNQTLALAAMLALDGVLGATLVALATDGEDGPTDAAGAVVDGASLARARALGLDPARRLDDDDAYPVFDALGDLLRIGPTGTNVCDLVLALARP